MLNEFKEFINRGNVIDLAVAVVMGAAFAPVISAIVESILMPLIGLVFGEPNFDAIGRFGCEGGICAGSVGVAITALVNFFFVALALFFVVKAYNRMSRKSPEQDAAPEPDADPDDVVLLREIRDALRARPGAL
ncbi:large conductance mechanosensitive channel protein MscL [Nitriliruptor alkaliphilus]|uniref:large conductance mechanosensitive channel protein MscL n=1 Tax=Nitriliruptor alkaliphilus TaxID=427918 RepID=UPI00069764C1|nr:large conductance mechanosensitive channel protein MscL [Nitriliruptor alkaliphilus]